MPLVLSPFTINDATDSAEAKLSVKDLDKWMTTWCLQAIHDAHHELSREVIALIMRERRDEILALVPADALVDGIKQAIADAIVRLAVPKAEQS